MSNRLGDPPVFSIVVVGGASLLCAGVDGEVVLSPRTFVRADTNDDGQVDIADGVTVLEYLFSDGAAPGCLAAADINVDSTIDLGDPITLFNYLLLGGPPPAAPFPDCGDGVFTFSCDEFESCP